jgi:PAS domain S-box-containing protein
MTHSDESRNHPLQVEATAHGKGAAIDWGLLIAMLIPLLALGLQWKLWDYIAPFVWFLFFPAVFFSARLGGFRGGVFSTILSTLLVWYFFIPPRLSWQVSNPYNLFSAVMFLIMGYLFSDVQERFRAAERRVDESLVETRLAHEKISQLYQKTLELDELKSQFFANVSHELRTPLTLILGPVKKALQTPDLSPNVRHDFEVVERNARFLYRHVADLLDVSRLDAGRMTIRYAQVDLAVCARLLASQFEVSAAERKIAFSIDVPPSLMAQVDLEKCQRILLNLLSNAFKFTPDQGKITLTLGVEADWAVFQVSDNGPGIPAEKRDVIFERFRQLDGDATRRHGGTGLGLSIASEFVRLHCGEIQVGDAPGGGAQFTVRLPILAPAGSVVESQPADELDGEIGHQLIDELSLERAVVRENPPEKAELPRVLVVEDNPDMCDFISIALASHYRVSVATDGRKGLEKAIALKPDLILSDVMMPIMSGDEMVQAIRQQADLKDVPIVMLTAKADDELRLQMLKECVQDYIYKPFSVDELLVRLENLLTVRQQAAEEIQLREERFRQLLYSVEDIIFTLDAQQRHTGVYGPWVAKNGLTPEFFLGKTAREILGEADAAVHEDANRRALAGEYVIYDWSTSSADGVQFYQTSLSPLRDATGAIMGLAGLGRNVTILKQAEAALRASEESLRLSQRVAHVGHWTWDTVANRVTWSEEMYRIFGLDPSTFDGDLEKVIATSIHPDDREKVNASNNAVLTEQKPAPIEYRVVWPDQTVRTVWAEAGEKVFDSDGKIIRLSGIVQDITDRKRIEIALAENEQNLRVIFETMSEGIALNEIVYDENGEMVDYRILMVNQAFYSVADYHGSEVVGNVATQLYGMSPEFIKEFWYVHKEKATTAYAEMLSPLGNRYFYVATSPFVDGRFVTSFFDITKRKLAEQALSKNEETLRLVFNTMEEGMALNELLFDENGEAVNYRILEINPAYESISFLTRDQAIGKLASEIYGMTPEQINAFWKMHQHNEHAITTDMYVPEIQKWRHISTSKLIGNKFVTIFFDNTDQKNAEAEIIKSLAEKETLLRELYHRTKNNMAVIIALLEMQAGTFDDARLLAAFREAQNRIRSMALVHQKLYETSDLSRINLKEYVTDLVHLLMKSYNISPESLILVLEMADVFVLIDTAIPCGLIMNELISNALKYAFPLPRVGEIKLGLNRDENGEIHLSVADNGVGVPPGFDFRRDGHLGVQNILLLAEQQLQGEVAFDTIQGVACHLRFRDIFYESRI